MIKKQAKRTTTRDSDHPSAGKVSSSSDTRSADATIDRSPAADEQNVDAVNPAGPAEATVQTVSEHGGPAGLEPTRYGDWEKKGRCIDF